MINIMRIKNYVTPGRAARLRASSLVHEVGPRSRTEGGSKCEGLKLLMRMGFPVPRTWVVPVSVFSSYLTDPLTVRSELRAAIARTLPPDGCFAVRSSADVEDGAERSYAGQFRTHLDVVGASDIVESVVSVWESARTANSSAYSTRVGVSRHVQMGVLIQEMVMADVSGVAFSHNPLTGAKAPVVEAVEGSGVALVQEGVSPVRWEGGRLSRDDSRVPADLLEKVATETSRIAAKMGAAVDLEWVYDGSRTMWVQIRPITALRDAPLYSSRLAKEMLPGLIKPLVWSVNVPLVNGAWARIFSELTGRRDIDPLKLSRAFYYRAYFNMGEVGKILESMGLPEDALESMTMGGGMRFSPTPQAMAAVPRLLVFLFGKLGFHSQVEDVIEVMEPKFSALRCENLSLLSDHELLRRMETLHRLAQHLIYYQILTILVASMYTAMLKRMRERMGHRLDRMDWGSQGAMMDQIYPNNALADLVDAVNHLDEGTRRRLAGMSFAEVLKDEGTHGLQERLREFVRLYGHYRESGNDFSTPSWGEDPDLVWKLVTSLCQDGVRRDKIAASKLDPPFGMGLFLQGLCTRAAKYSLLRERVSSTYTKGYGTFRRYFLEIGERLVRRQVLESPEDVFFLFAEEVRAALLNDGAGPLPGYMETARARREEMASLRDITLPEVIIGDAPPPFNNQCAEVLRGLPTSGGYFQGRARVVRGMSDFVLVRPGEVLVIPFSDISWSGIFAKAGAIISESGGLLSHSSIVAREFGIPAVVSVPSAMAIPDGTMVAVDGYRGEVRLEN